jgi:3-methyl-2-oxobutanoate hydroxymethyltransferase
MRLTVSDIQARKNPSQPIVCLTAYTTPMAKTLLPHVDILLVGDSVGTVLYGMDNTVGVSLEMMIAHGRAVMRSKPDIPVVVDMPFGTYERDAAQALENAHAIIGATGAHAVKLEGGLDMARQIEAITASGVAVMGHIGLQPQSVVREGGYKIKGKTDAEIVRLIEDAKAVERAGAFAIVIEGTIAEVATAITQAVGIPTIGIGGSAECDGQVLVTEDMLGLLHGHKPKFVSEYAQLRDQMDEAVRRFAADVRAREFPRVENLYTLKK